MTSVGPPQFDFDIDIDASPDPPPAPTRNGLVAALGVGVVVIIVGLVAVFWDPMSDPIDAGSSVPPTTNSVPIRSIGVEAEELVTPGIRYDFNVAGLAVHGLTPTGEGFMAFVAGPDPGTIVRLTSSDGQVWIRGDADPIVDALAGPNPVAVWPTLDDRYLGAFRAEKGRSLTLFISSDGISWRPLTSFRGDGLMQPSVAAVGSDHAVVTITRTTGGPPEVVEQVTIDLDTGATEPLALVDEPIRAAAADPSTDGFIVVTEGSGSEATLHEIRRIGPDGRSLPLAGPHPGPIEGLGLVNGDIVAFTAQQAFRLDSETSRWSSAVAFRSDSAQRYVDVITGAGGAAVLLAESDPELDGVVSVAVTRDAVVWTEVAIDERLSNPQLRVLGEEAVLIDAFQTGVGTVRLRVPLES